MQTQLMTLAQVEKALKRRTDAIRAELDEVQTETSVTRNEHNLERLAEIERALNAELDLLRLALDAAHFVRRFGAEAADPEMLASLRPYWVGA